MQDTTRFISCSARFQAKLFGWKSPLSEAQTGQIGSAKQVMAAIWHPR